MIVERQTSSARPSSTSGNGGASATLGTATSTTSDNPFFPSPISSSNTQISDHQLAKSILEWMFLAIAISLILATILRRLISLRSQGLPPSRFFRTTNATRRQSRSRPSAFPRNFPRTTGIPPFRPEASTVYYEYPRLSNLPRALYHSSPSIGIGISVSDRRTRAADTDGGGRRGGGGPSDYHGELGDKDELPAYDKFGGPPMYIELDMRDRTARNMGGMGGVSLPTVEEDTGTEESVQQNQRGRPSEHASAAVGSEHVPSPPGVSAPPYPSSASASSSASHQNHPVPSAEPPTYHPLQ